MAAAHYLCMEQHDSGNTWQSTLNFAVNYTLHRSEACLNVWKESLVELEIQIVH